MSLLDMFRFNKDADTKVYQETLGLLQGGIKDVSQNNRESFPQYHKIDTDLEEAEKCINSGDKDIIAIGKRILTGALILVQQGIRAGHSCPADIVGKIKQLTA